jgi:sulfur relay (sulfurtransferase) complex TusBCD TusD component (DsrE family)
MILPQLEYDVHGVDVVGMFFFEDNTYFLLKGTPLGDRLAKVAREQGFFLMASNQCCQHRGIKDDMLIEGARIGCFPNFYEALADERPDQIVTL